MKTLKNKIQIAIIDDHPTMCHGLSRLINQEPDFHVCATAETILDAKKIIQENAMDLVILDIGLNDSESGLDLIPLILENKQTDILVFTMYDDIITAHKALHAGARGYLTKSEPVRQVIVGIRKILDGLYYVSESINQAIIKQFVSTRSQHDTDPYDILSRREFEIFELIGKGFKPQNIACKINLSVKTIETHRTNIRKKLNLSDAAEVSLSAVKYLQNRKMI